MSAITVRNLPDATHLALRRLAGARSRSVEALVRETLVAFVEETPFVPGKPPGLSEAAGVWPMPPGAQQASFETLWGALKGRVHAAAGTDLAAPTNEVWEAESGV